MPRPLLLVLLASPRTKDECRALLRRLRRLTHDTPHPALLLCDLPDAPVPETEEDDVLLRTLQSGVMSMERHAPGRYRLLVRSRVYDPAARLYLGSGQPQDARQTAAQLICGGRTSHRFAAVSRAPGSLVGCCRAALFLQETAICTPDTPERLLRHLDAGEEACLAGRMLIPSDAQSPLITRLLRTGFSLSARDHARTYRLHRTGMTPAAAAPALLVSEEGLAAMASSGLPQACAVADDCLFLPAGYPSMADLLAHRQIACAHALRPGADSAGDRLDAAIPLLGFLFMLMTAISGRLLPAAAALLCAEWPALLHPALLPGMLVRLCLLPVNAMCSLDALLRRLLAHSPLLRIELTPFFFGGGFCAASGAALLFPAFLSGHALAAMMALSLLWLAAPLLIRALNTPPRERIPLSDQEQQQLLSMARRAVLGVAQDEPAPQRMLVACAGCMLGLLEPDEAARQAEQLLRALPENAACTSADVACAFAAAQYLRERMADCDAVLRPLPARIEQRFLRVCAAPMDKRLDLLIARTQRVPAPQPPVRRRETSGGLCTVFLPERILTGSEAAPLTHPHAFLQAHTAPLSGAYGALLLTEAALGRPFLALLQRSPVAGPYAPLLYL